MPIQGFKDAFELIESINLIDFFPSAFSRWEEVKHQAIRHTRDIVPYGLLREQRPNESENVRDYRLDNYRQITNEGVVKFNDKTSRIINNSNFTIQNKSDELTEWLANSEWSLENGEQVKFREYFSRFVLPCSFEDPNALLVALPVNTQNPAIPPAAPIEEGGNPRNQTIGIKTMVIQSCHIRYIDDNVFAWKADYLFPFIGLDRKPKEAPFFFICDKNNYYRFVPVSETKDGIQYNIELWYNHDTGQGDEHELPVNILGGTLTKDDVEHGHGKVKVISSVTFNESFMRPFFEYGDEVIVTFSDWQAVKTKGAYPIKVMKAQPCQECNGNMKIRGFKDGLEAMVTCTECNGTGTAKGLSPFKDLIWEESALKNESNRPPLEYVSPPVDIIRYLEDAWRGLLKDGKKSINLDMLTDSVESGKAKEKRLEDTEDMLSKIAANLFDVMERYLWQVECLLVTNRANRQRPVIVRPTSFDVKSEEDLRLAVSQAHPSDVITALMDFYKVKYRGNDELIRIKELALMYAPLLAVSDIQELNTLIMTGAYSSTDLVKRQQAELILRQIAKEGIDIFETTNLQRIFDRANELIQPFLPQLPTPLI